MCTWDAVLLRVWLETDGVRGRVVRSDGGPVAVFSSAREAGEIVERWVLEITGEGGAADADA
ncbi:hypothetical protein [Actinomadura sp. SCN-SB]|uniref:hypothetical protein n=1 Tax=Actinomadura sp. SCN-SB TaxID=3373092 RepID=UPI003751B67C